MKRTKVIEIVAARDIVFALAHSGVCAAFSRGILKDFLKLSPLRRFYIFFGFLFELQRRIGGYAF